jgi:uncharacterized membrane protein
VKAPGSPAPDPARHAMSPIERTIHWTLLVGLALSVVLMAVGVLLGAMNGAGLPRGAVSLGSLRAELLAGSPAAYLSLGLIVLIATPFVRVAGSLVVFARQRDARFVLVTAVVLAVMCASVLLGRS